ncbi:hypothetical protein, conserved [Trypanosoma brucei gambiense DAL972]|uniref:Uncharacterized protein n=1 Tax=Trypanosoma brucei gambiense (strain MHOM/CI/86/DAL972) TaxID=679716 RepID=C9ZKC0_TRYB9|nr:hypothetical protein, conserved [Trypanosoma brucei gambiense DAL972]CBH09884.1 hypothetical protein, conserved [Trypanosoma brucei gambiense DAL972]|eukprot:XP_011772177.1 hypothetical protein, conserved [Trypanosoma brucei gambiense DAL972]
MTVKRETESILAIADEVIASIEGYPRKDKLQQPSIEGKPVVAPPSSFSKSIQTESKIFSKGVQHSIYLKDVGIQCAQQPTNRDTQTECFTFSSSTQTEPDTTLVSVKRGIKDVTKNFAEKSEYMERLLECLAVRLDRCRTNVHKVATQLADLAASRRILEQGLNDIRVDNSVTRLIQQETEVRNFLWDEEHVSRNEVVMLALSEMRGYYVKHTSPLLENRCECVPNTDDPSLVQKCVSGATTLPTGDCTDVDEYLQYNPVSNLVSEQGEYFKDMEMLLSECLAVLDKENIAHLSSACL